MHDLSIYSLCSIHSDFLLLEIPSIFLVNQHQIEVVLHTELVVDVSVCGCQIVGTQE